MKTKSIVILVGLLVLLLPAGYIAKDRIEVLTQSQSHSAVILSCKSKSHRKVGGRRGWGYAPVAVTPSGHKAIGTKFISDASWCRSQIGRKTSILVNPSDPKKNRINSFFQFWLFPSFILLALGFITLGRNAKLNFLFFAGFFAIAGGATAKEFGALDGMLGSGKIPRQLHSNMALNFCIQNAMAEEKVQYKADLRRLNCSNFNITDISALSDFTGLQELRLWRNKITSLEPLADMTELRVLGLSRNRKLASLEGLERLTKLETLHARNMKVTDLTPLSGMKNLRVVDLYDNKISDLTVFSDFSYLEELTVSRNPVRDLSPLKDKPALKKLTFYRSEVRDISALYGNQRLQQVGINQMQGHVDCAQVRELKARLLPSAKVYVPKSCR